MLQMRSLLLGAAIFGSGVFFSRTVDHSLISEAQAVDGAWACYVVDKFPNLEKAAEWRGAIDYADALSRLAPNAPEGKILVGTYPVGGLAAGQGGAPILCVKN